MLFPWYLNMVQYRLLHDKTDIQSVFRIIPVYLKDWEILRMSWEGHPYEMGSAVAALQNSFKKHYKTAVKWLAAAVANFGC